MKTIQLILCLLFVASISKAQYLKWGKRHDTYLSSNNSPYSSWNKGIEVDKTKNAITFGLFRDSIDMDPGPNVFMMYPDPEDSYIQKLDSNGNFIWALKFQRITGSSIIQSIAVDQNGDILIIGTFTGMVDFDPGIGTNTLVAYSSTSSGTSSDLFFVKLGSAGNFIWAKSIGIPQFDEEAISVAVDQDNNALFLTSYGANTDADPNAGVIILPAGTNIIKLDSAGNTIWAKHVSNLAYNTNNWILVNPSDSQYRTIRTDKNNNVFTTGIFAGTVDFDPGPGIYNLSGAGAYLQKLDPNGNLKWVLQFDQLDPNLPRFDVDTFGNTFFVSTHDTDINSSTVILGYSVRKIDSSGNTLWKDEINHLWVNGFINAAKTDDRGNFYLLFDADTAIQVVTANSTVNSNVTGWIFHNPLISFKPDGDVQFIKIQKPNCIRSMATFEDEIFLSGNTEELLNIDIDFSQTFVGLSTIEKCEYVARYKRCLSLIPSITLSGSTLVCSNMPANTSYSWYLNGLPIGSNNNTLSIISNGLYSLEIITSEGCSGTNSLTVTTLGIQQPEASLPIFVYPNPTTNQVFIQNTLNENYSCLIFDALGNKVKEFQFHNNSSIQEIALNKYGLSTGIYIFNIIDAKSKTSNYFRISYIE
ncbi:MAG: T9SS type A sorting domain-containing protein [Chitinophagaceae bacterium]|nr:T9SS type A sorting domain-containing protein [Chitinophagaceae bacterium]